MRVELPGSVSQLSAALPVSREGHQVAQVLDRESVHRVQGDGSLRGIAEGIELFSEVVRLGQRQMRQVIGRGGVHRSSRGVERPAEGVGLHVEPEPVLFTADHRQHHPGICVLRRLLDGPFQALPDHGMLIGPDPLVVAAAPQHRLVGAQCVDGLAPDGFAERPRQDPGPVGDGRHDPGDKIVLKREQVFGAEGPVVGLRPQMGAGRRVDQLDRDAQLRAGLPEAPLHHVAGTDLRADSPHVDRATSEPGGRAPRDHPQVREPRQACHDLLGQPLGQRRQIGIGAGVLERQHRDPEALVGSCRLCAIGRSRACRHRWGLRRRQLRNGQPRLAEPVEHVLDERARPQPLLVVLTRDRGEVRPQRQQLPKGPLRRLPLAELPVGHRERGVGGEVGGHVELQGHVQRGTVVACVVRLRKRAEAIPPGVVRVDLHRPLGQRAAVLPVAGVRDEVAHVGRGARVHGVEGDGLLGRAAKGLELATEEERLGEHVIRQVARGRGRDRASRRPEGAAQGIGLHVETVLVLVRVEHRQERPAVGVVGRVADGALQGGPRRRVLLLGDALVVREGQQQRLVRGQRLRVPIAERLAHGARQDAVHVGDSRDDPRNKVVLQLEDSLRRERPGVGLGPQVGAADGVDQLRGDAQRASRLAQASLHHVAGADLMADGPHVERATREAGGRAARDHPQVREPRQARHDLLGQPLGQGGEVRAAAAVLERQHRDPEGLVGAGGAGVSRRRRSRGRGHLGVDR